MLVRYVRIVEELWQYQFSTQDKAYGPVLTEFSEDYNAEA